MPRKYACQSLYLPWNYASEANFSRIKIILSFKNFKLNSDEESEKTRNVGNG